MRSALRLHRVVRDHLRHLLLARGRLGGRPPRWRGAGGGLQPSDGRALGVALPSRALVARGRYFVPGDALCSSNFVGVDYFEASKRATALGATEDAQVVDGFLGQLAYRAIAEAQIK